MSNRYHIGHCVDDLEQLYNLILFQWFMELFTFIMAWY